MSQRVRGDELTIGYRDAADHAQADLVATVLDADRADMSLSERSNGPALGDDRFDGGRVASFVRQRHNTRQGIPRR